MTKIKFLLPVCLLLIAFACESDNDATDGVDNPPSNVSFDRTPLLENWADNIIIPAYNDFVTRAQAMTADAVAFQELPSLENLENVRASWLDAYTIWQRVSMFENGPAETIGLRLQLNTYPADTNQINTNATTGDYNLSLSSNRDAKGFPALDYLLYSQPIEDLITFYNGDQGPNFLAYLVDVVQDIEALSTQVRDEWSSGFRDDFVNNNGSSANASVDRYVNDYIFYLERNLRAGKMGIPGGVFSGTVDANLLEGRFIATISNDMFLEGLNAIQNFFEGRSYTTGANGLGLDDYLDTLDVNANGTLLSTVINDQFDLARNAVENLDSFQNELSINPPSAFLEAYGEVQRLVPLLKVDMVSALSIGIDFVDADGD